jgi:hypothetical protein
MSQIGKYAARVIGLCLCLSLLGAPVLANESYEPVSGVRLTPIGKGEFRRFGFLIYEAALWGGSNPQQPPLALQLTYKRNIEGRKIVDASVQEMRQLGATEPALKVWETQMTQIFPDVKPGDQLTGVYKSGGAVFLFNNREVGEIKDPEFARYFFAIWLDPKTSAPGLRQNLLSNKPS